MARDAEREARLGAVLQVDAPFVQHQQATLSSSQEEEQQQPPPLAPHLRLCVDLGYGDEIHGERGTRSLGQQLGWIWNAMKLASSERETPVLHLVSYEGKVRACVRPVLWNLCDGWRGGWFCVGVVVVMIMSSTAPPTYAHTHTHIWMNERTRTDGARAGEHGAGELAHLPAPAGAGRAVSQGVHRVPEPRRGGGAGGALV